MTQPLTLASIQMVSRPRVADNLKDAAALIAKAADAGAQLVALPEYFPLIAPDEAAKVAVRESLGRGPIQDFLAETARRHRIWLVGGTVPLEASQPEKVRNTCLAFSPDGERVAAYDKIHLFGFERGAERYNESATIEAGSRIVAFDTPFARVGLAVCYDLRFPELFRAMGAVDILVVPAAFTETTGQAHWELLLRARAVENQCYVLASAQGGEHESGRRTWGDSMIIDPWGEVLARQPKGAGVVLAPFDAARIHDIRASLPALRHRRADLQAPPT